MENAIPTELLMKLCRATPEQLAEVERILEGGAEGGTMEHANHANSGGKAHCSFRKAGRYWEVKFDGAKVFCLEDTLGARYLDYLLHRPNQPVAAFDLELAVQPEKARARSITSVQSLLDTETARSYLRELTRLRQERDDAENAGDIGWQERLDVEIAALEEAVQHKGCTADSGERARGNVSKAIAAVLRSLSKGEGSEKAFAEHVRRFVDRGYQCMYIQEGRTWM